MRTSDELLADLKKLHPLLIDLSLGRIEALLGKLGNPERRLPPVIHVAGTNGKGSVTAFLRAMLEAAGLRVHVYTSPHLVRFHERIALAGADRRAHPIGERELVDRLTAAQRINAGEPITFFEITTAAALRELHRALRVPYADSQEVLRARWMVDREEQHHPGPLGDRHR